MFARAEDLVQTVHPGVGWSELLCAVLLVLLHQATGYSACCLPVSLLQIKPIAASSALLVFSSAGCTLQ